MSEREFNANFFEQFLDDYFAESDEHLILIKRNLLVFEDTLDLGKKIETSIFNELFRSFHTIKGISAMANVSAAETLAHYMEDYLRLLRDGLTQLTNEGLVTLIESTKKLEQIIVARRTDEEIPPIELEVNLLKSLTQNKKINEIDSSAPIKLSETTLLSSSNSFYLFTFAPAPELAERGINVNIVRERLQTIGVIQKSTPSVKSGGKIAFEFIVETQSDETIFIPWETDGLIFKKVENPEQEIQEIKEKKPLDIQKLGLLGQSNLVRVDLSRLDELMLMVGELVISRAKLTDQLKQIENGLPSGQWRNLQEINHLIEKQLRNLRDGVMRVRMIPIGEVFERMQFAIRDLARETGNQIRLNIKGENTEIDKFLVERMLDPLLHLVRNSVSHGIEDSQTRQVLGKSSEG
ncbi:MAG TPA: Hpt domain-containing protein, partial [Pyrinomonadaceae bacterium]|nr:Hpt domain-containing protein [Pyrinomonadaceae bacterium]